MANDKYSIGNGSTHGGGYSFALIRDPKERLVSAWKSKFACDDLGYDVDTNDRGRMMTRLVAHLGGFRANYTCFSLEDYITALGICHRDPTGKALRGLNDHIIPQTDACFLKYPPKQWTRVVSSLDIGSLRQIAERAGNRSAADHYPHMHTSSALAPGQKKPLSTSELVASLGAESSKILDEITAKEYVMLGPYL